MLGLIIISGGLGFVVVGSVIILVFRELPSVLTKFCSKNPLVA